MATAFEAATSTEHITHYTFVSFSIMFQYCLAQIVVTRSDFAPYQFVSFEAITLDSENALETEVSEMVLSHNNCFTKKAEKILELVRTDGETLRDCQESCNIITRGLVHDCSMSENRCWKRRQQ